MLSANAKTTAARASSNHQPPEKTSSQAAAQIKASPTVSSAFVEPRWWTLRPAQSLKPASYVCPFCDGMLHATSEHALVAPEGDVSKRRHAHMECVVAERRKGRLVTEDEWRRRSTR